ncbi:hypothetical protein MAR_011488 [Mya arenaria]|uniref:Uncharacterized protein n=1 Tax=Mya arenaria TaxID=6604 RepID=A0ABY7FWY8_MYAAR|nr:hypothetical protein MAR_011488 [Mya arenaria]
MNYKTIYIYLIHSLGCDRLNDRIIPDGLKIQLSQMYGKIILWIVGDRPSHIRLHFVYIKNLVMISYSILFNEGYT